MYYAAYIIYGSDSLFQLFLKINHSRFFYVVENDYIYYVIKS